METTTKDVFIIIDVQNDFCPDGALAVTDGDAVVPVINSIAARFVNVIATQDWHPHGHASFASTHDDKSPFEVLEFPYGPQVLWPDHCVQETPGAAFHKGLDIPHLQTIVRKGYNREIDSYSAFLENDHATPTGLAGYLRTRGIERVFLAGLATDFCVQFSALDACTEGFETIVIPDACRAIDLDGSLDAAMTAMQRAGVRFMESSDILSSG